MDNDPEGQRRSENLPSISVKDVQFVAGTNSTALNSSEDAKDKLACKRNSKEACQVVDNGENVCTHNDEQEAHKRKKGRSKHQTLWKCGAFSVLGRRSQQEDTAFVSELSGRLPSNVTLGKSPEDALFAVFDGHGGNKASAFCARALEGKVSALEAQGGRDMKEVLATAVKTLDEEFCESAERLTRNSMVRNFCLDDGTTALIAALRGDSLYVANVGDSRAIIVKRDGCAEALTEDHKPSRPDEKHRIQNSGAKVTGLILGRSVPTLLIRTWPFSMFFDVPRVNGILAMSRAIGDRTLKPHVTAEAEITVKLIDPNDWLLVLATDGVWDVMSNNRVASVLSASMRDTGGDVALAAMRLARVAMEKGSKDNATVVIVDLSTHKTAL